MRTHNITTLTGEIFDKLANNTNYNMFDCNEADLKRFEVDENAGKLYIEYHDKHFTISINEA